MIVTTEISGEGGPKPLRRRALAARHGCRGPAGRVGNKSKTVAARHGWRAAALKHARKPDGVILVTAIQLDLAILVSAEQLDPARRSSLLFNFELAGGVVCT